MKKNSKIWLWIFLAMFIIPEILWSPSINFIYSFFSAPVFGQPQLLRNNFLFEYNFESLLKIIIFIQLIGIIFFFLFWLKNMNNVRSRVAFWIVLILSLLVCLMSMFIFYLVFIFSPNFF